MNPIECEHKYAYDLLSLENRLKEMHETKKIKTALVCANDVCSEIITYNMQIYKRTPLFVDYMWRAGDGHQFLLKSRAIYEKRQDDKRPT